MKLRKFVPWLLLPLCGCMAAQPTPTSASSSTTLRTISSGERQRIDFLSSVNADCTTAGYGIVRVITPPLHGELTTERGMDYPNYLKGNQRYKCNLQKVPLINVYYKSNPGYVGVDTATIEGDSPVIATAQIRTYMISVK
jgi:hypothetical protein